MIAAPLSISLLIAAAPLAAATVPDDWEIALRAVFAALLLLGGIVTLTVVSSRRV